MELIKELIKQPTFETCGQAYIAMITGKDITDEIRNMKTNSLTSIGQLIEILDKYEIHHAEKNVRISKKNPKPYQYSILTVYANGGYTNWVVLYDGKYFDPEFGVIEGKYMHGKITSYLGIFEN